MNQEDPEIMKQKVAAFEKRLRSFSESTQQKYKFREIFEKLWDTSHLIVGQPGLFGRAAFKQLFQSSRDVSTITEQEFLLMKKYDNGLRESTNVLWLSAFALFFGLVSIIGFTQYGFGWVSYVIIAIGTLGIIFGSNWKHRSKSGINQITNKT